MGFIKVRESLGEYFQNKTLLNKLVQNVDILAVIVAAVQIFSYFWTIPTILSTVLYYTFFLTIILGVASKGSTALLISFATPTLLNLLRFLTSIFNKYFSLTAFMDFAVYALLFMCVFVHVSQFGLGESVLSNKISEKTKFKVNPPSALFCTHCGTKSDGISHICTKCGKNIR